MGLAAGEIIVTLIGNIVADPTIRFTNDGGAVANFRIACTPRRFDRDTNQWVDQETTFVNVVGWRALAENIAESLKKGQSVMVTGSLRNRQYTTADGQTGYSLEVYDPFVGPSLQYQTAVVTKNPPRSQGQPPARTSAPAPAGAPMGGAVSGAARGGFGEPPF